MNYNKGFYDNIVFDTDLERAEKIKKQRKVFSRLFLGLFTYLLSFQLIGSLVFAVLPLLLNEAQSAALESSATASVLISSGVQYLISFPLFVLITKGIGTSEKTNKTKLSAGETVIFIAISQVLMMLGSLVGNFINSVVGTVIGEIPENGIETVIEETPMWLIFIIMVIIGPIVEELIFRKIMIDRLSVYGDHVAIIFSAVAFGLMHGNLYQLFYALLLGLLLGYVYTKTRDVKYTVIIHMILNFLGSIVALPVQEALEKLTELIEALYAGVEFSMSELITSIVISMSYTALQYGLIISGLIALIYWFRNRNIRVSTDKEIFIPDKDIIKNGSVNAGFILFSLISIALMVLNLF